MLEMKDRKEVIDKERPWRKQIGDRSRKACQDVHCEKRCQHLEISGLWKQIYLPYNGRVGRTWCYRLWSPPCLG